MSTASVEELNRLWASKIEPGLERIIRRLEEGISHAEYLLLYSSVHDFCTKTRAPDVQHHHVTGTQGAQLIGAEVYHRLKVYLEHYLRDLYENCPKSGEQLLEFYNRKWSQFVLSAKLVNNVFSYLNRHWVKREHGINPKIRDVYDIYTTMMVCWKETFFLKLSRNLTASVLELFERERGGEVITSTLIRSVIESYVNLGLDATNTNRKCLNVYEEYFERPFFVSSEDYFRKKSQTFIAENPVTEYLKKVETWLVDEQQRVERFLHNSTKPELLKKCQNIMIAEHKDVIREEFVLLLQNDKEEDLARTFTLLSHITDGLTPLRLKFEQHVLKVGLTAVEDVAINAAKDEENQGQLDPKLYVETILKVYNHYNQLVGGPFRSDAGFLGSLDRACREIVNKNKVTEKSASKTSELLAKFCDAILKKSAKNPEKGELEEILGDVMIFFKYVDDKDVFQKFYQKMLARRLVQQLSASDDAEESMISKLKEACGYDYTQKLQRMFTDMGTSRDLNNQFKDHIKNSDQGIGVDFYINVLCTGSWPLQPASFPLIIPQALEKSVERFQNFYQAKYSGRKLNWLWNLCKGELKMNFAKGGKISYMLQVSTYQMCVLLQYNVADAYTHEELLNNSLIASSTGGESGDSEANQAVATARASAEENLTHILSIMTKARILNANGEVGKASTKYSLNMAFSNKKLRINLNAPLKAEQKQESDEAHKSVEEDRKMLLQAAIVRVMKTRKTLKHVNLVQEVIQIVQARFQPKISEIKKCIDILIEKEYLERVEGQKDQFRYLA